MPTTINLDTMSFEELLRLATAAKLNPGAALRAMAKLGPDGRRMLGLLMTQAVDKADASKGAKGINIRGSLVNKAKEWRKRDRRAALAFWELAAARRPERIDAMVSYQSGVAPGAEIVAGGELSLFQLKLVSLALADDWRGVLKALRDHPAHASFVDGNGRSIVRAGEHAMVAATAEIGCLALPGQAPIPLPGEAIRLVVG